MFLKLIDEIITCFGTVIEDIQDSTVIEISPPVCEEDDEAEMMPLFENDFEINYLDEVPF